MWVRIHEILPDKRQYYRVITRWNEIEAIAYYTGYDFIDKETKKILIIDKWYREIA